MGAQIKIIKEKIPDDKERITSGHCVADRVKITVFYDMMSYDVLCTKFTTPYLRKLLPLYQV
jgi:hypothetical protein